MQYHVTSVSLEDGTLTVSNMLNDTNYGKEEIVRTTNDGSTFSGPLEDQYGLSIEYSVFQVKWAAANLTCETAVQKNTAYACRSIHSYCLNVTHGEIFMGHRCKCISGFHGNPYVQDGCTGSFFIIPLQSAPTDRAHAYKCL